MSALGQKRTSEHVQSMSALPPKADIETQSRNVRFVPKADICGAAIDVVSSAAPSRRSCHTPLRTDDAFSLLQRECGPLAVANRATGAPNIGHAPTQIAMPRVRITRPGYTGLRVNHTDRS